MSTIPYRSPRSFYPAAGGYDDDGYILEPLPVPQDHPELDLWGVERMRMTSEAQDRTLEDGKAAGLGQDGELSSPGSPRPGMKGDTTPQLGQEVVAEPEMLMKARMMNEFVYCPRLFFYEQVEGIFVSNADTERGAALHEKVDRGKGALAKAKKQAVEVDESSVLQASQPAEFTQEARESAPPDEMAEIADLKNHLPEKQTVKEEVLHSRSAMLSSSRLGVVAKMDLIEVNTLRVELSLAPASASGKSPTLPRKKAKLIPGQPDLFSQLSEQPTATATEPACIQVKPYERQILSVTPVDYKAGAPRLGKEGTELWDADKMQLGLQILILRDNGYTCDEGVIYYRSTKQRVPLSMTPELELWITTQVTEARALATSGQIPAPLVSSPKCIRCSLAPVCLPDETRALSSTRQATTPAQPPGRELPDSENKPLGTDSSQRVRRLIAARDDERALYLNTQGHRVGLKSERLVIKDGDSQVDEIRISDISHVALFGNIQLSTQAIQELCEQEIPVAYFSTGGWFYGLTRGHGLKNVTTRIQQFATAANPLRCLTLAQKIVRAKIRNHRTMLMRLHLQPPAAAILQLKEIAARTVDARGLDELLGMEGAAAAAYFQQFSGMIKVGASDPDDQIPGLEDTQPPSHNEDQETFRFDFQQRKRRPPTDPVNALLSLAYSLLAKDCTIAALAVGLDPYVGFYHQPRHGRPALALDLMEEFRPLIAESTVLTAINNRMIVPGHFVRAGDAVNLTPHGRKALFHAYEQRMNALITHPVFDYKVSYRRVLELQARLLARWLTGEIPDYLPMVTR